MSPRTGTPGIKAWSAIIGIGVVLLGLMGITAESWRSLNDRVTRHDVQMDGVVVSIRELTLVVKDLTAVVSTINRTGSTGLALEAQRGDATEARVDKIEANMKDINENLKQIDLTLTQVVLMHKTSQDMIAEHMGRATPK